MAQEPGQQGTDFTSKIDQTQSGSFRVPDEQLAFFENEREKIEPNFELLGTGDIKPQGWILDIMRQDLEDGFVGALDELAPDIILQDDLFNTTRRVSKKDIPDVGDQVLTGAPWEISMQWWSGETKGVWWDGYIRHAYLTNSKKDIERSRKIIEYMLTTQDDDGYIGIYAPSMRYQHTGSNGELWAQTVVFRTMLAYYEFTGERKVLDAVERAMDVTMKHYGPEGRSPFNLPEPTYGGVTHGLMMTDVCERLYSITGDQAYQDYAVYLYQEFSRYGLNRSMSDMRYEHLTYRDSLFVSHSAHTYEHLRTLINAYHETSYPELASVLDNALHKLSFTMLPSGAGFGNEWLNAEVAKPDSTGAEMCGMMELRDFFMSAVQKTGQVHFADQAEKMTFNAMLGARNEDGTAITYCKTDNCYILDRKAPQHGFEEYDPRYKYSPTHADAAVCCNPSYSRNFPYFVRQMWMKANDGLAAVLYGPNKLETTYDDVRIEITSDTSYPLADNINLTVNPDQEVIMSLYFRKPGFVEEMHIESSDATFSEVDGYYKITKLWKRGDEVRISFVNKVEAIPSNNNSIYFQRGPLVFAHIIPHETEVVKSYPIESFADYYCLPQSEDSHAIAVRKGKASYGFTFTNGDKADHWYDNDIRLTGTAINTERGEEIEIEMVPMGQSVLRRVTIPVIDQE